MSPTSPTWSPLETASLRLILAPSVGLCLTTFSQLAVSDVSGARMVSRKIVSLVICKTDCMFLLACMKLNYSYNYLAFGQWTDAWPERER